MQKFRHGLAAEATGPGRGGVLVRRTLGVIWLQSLILFSSAPVTRSLNLHPNSDKNLLSRGRSSSDQEGKSNGKPFSESEEIVAEQTASSTLQQHHLHRKASSINTKNSKGSDHDRSPRTSRPETRHFADHFSHHHHCSTGLVVAITLLCVLAFVVLVSVFYFDMCGIMPGSTSWFGSEESEARYYDSGETVTTASGQEVLIKDLRNNPWWLKGHRLHPHLDVMSTSASDGSDVYREEARLVPAAAPFMSYGLDSQRPGGGKFLPEKAISFPPDAEYPVWDKRGKRFRFDGGGGPGGPSGREVVSPRSALAHEIRDQVVEELLRPGKKVVGDRVRGVRGAGEEAESDTAAVDHPPVRRGRTRSGSLQRPRRKVVRNVTRRAHSEVRDARDSTSPSNKNKGRLTGEGAPEAHGGMHSMRGGGSGKVPTPTPAASTGTATAEARARFRQSVRLPSAARNTGPGGRDEQLSVSDVARLSGASEHKRKRSARRSKRQSAKEGKISARCSSKEGGPVPVDTRTPIERKYYRRAKAPDHNIAWMKTQTGGDAGTTEGVEVVDHTSRHVPVFGGGAGDAGHKKSSSSNSSSSASTSASASESQAGDQNKRPTKTSGSSSSSSSAA